MVGAVSEVAQEVVEAEEVVAVVVLVEDQGTEVDLAQVEE